MPRLIVIARDSERIESPPSKAFTILQKKLLKGWLQYSGDERNRAPDEPEKISQMRQLSLALSHSCGLTYSSHFTWL